MNLLNILAEAIEDIIKDEAKEFLNYVKENTPEHYSTIKNKILNRGIENAKEFYKQYDPKEIKAKNRFNRNIDIKLSKISKEEELKGKHENLIKAANYLIESDIIKIFLKALIDETGIDSILGKVKIYKRNLFNEYIKKNLKHLNRRYEYEGHYSDIPLIELTIQNKYDRKFSKEFMDEPKHMVLNFYIGYFTGDLDNISDIKLNIHVKEFNVFSLIDYTFSKEVDNQLQKLQNTLNKVVHSKYFFEWPSEVVLLFNDIKKLIDYYKMLKSTNRKSNLN